VEGLTGEHDSPGCVAIRCSSRFPFCVYAVAPAVGFCLCSMIYDKSENFGLEGKEFYVLNASLRFEWDLNYLSHLLVLSVFSAVTSTVCIMPLSSCFTM
jgi:hypothetical protein